MRTFNHKTFYLIFVCTFLVAVWATDALASDVDNDGIGYSYDNCPETPNPGQQDVDNDGTGDACDDDTIYGYLSGEAKEGTWVNISTAICSMEEIIATVITEEDGYYAIGDLEDGWYEVTPEEDDNNIFNPKSASVQISTDR